MNLSILSYNIRFGGARREAKLAAVIESVQPDIVIFQEATVPRVIESIADAAGMKYWAAKPRHSIGYCSRIEIKEHSWHYPRGSRHAFLELLPAGTEFRIFGLHLRALFSNYGEHRRMKEIHRLLSAIEPHANGFHALIGDFNSLAPGELLDTKRMPHWIRAMLWFSGRDIQRRTVKHMRDHGYSDAFREMHPEDKGYTFPTYDPHVRLDYFFLPTNYANRLQACEVIESSPADRASDHFPLLTRLAF